MSPHHGLSIVWIFWLRVPCAEHKKNRELVSRAIHHIVPDNVPIKAVQVAEVKSVAFTIRVVPASALPVLARPLRTAPPTISQDSFGERFIWYQIWDHTFAILVIRETEFADLVQQSSSSSQSPGAPGRLLLNSARQLFTPHTFLEQAGSFEWLQKEYFRKSARNIV